MSALDLPACPICGVRDSLARRAETVDGHARIWYECTECGSELLWLGNDLWLDGDRWAFQVVGREDQAHLLHQSLTPGDLSSLAEARAVQVVYEERPRSEPLPPKPVVPALPMIVDQGPAEHVGLPAVPTVVHQAVLMPDGSLWLHVVPAGVQQPSHGNGGPQVFSPPPGWLPDVEAWQPQPTRPRSQVSPLLVIAVAITLICLLCTVAALILQALWV
jgi:hypothetical protein